MNRKRVFLALGCWLLAGGAVLVAIDWIVSSHYRRDRLAALLDDPRLLTGVSLEYLVVGLGVFGLIVAGSVLWAFAGLTRR